MIAPTWERDGLTVYGGHVLDVLRGLSDESVQCCVTSPPYWGLRDYGLPPQVWDGAEGCEHEWEREQHRRFNPAATQGGAASTLSKQKEAGSNYGDKLKQDVASNGSFCSLCGAWRGSLGLEPTPQLYIAHLVQVFDEVRRVLRGDGVLFVVIADSYASIGHKKSNSGYGTTGLAGGIPQTHSLLRHENNGPGLKHKDLCLVPERFAIAMQESGWWVRSRICWAKKAPMPESVTDRPTSAWEHVWMFTKSARYYWDAEGVKESSTGQTGAAANFRRETKDHLIPNQVAIQHRLDREPTTDNGSRNLRNFWLLGPEPRPEAHYATYPSEIPRRCIKAATSEKGCCPRCGRAWERVVERKAMVIDRSHNHPPELRTRTSGTMLEPAECKTLGWHPACTCGAGDPIPCTILDPFLGSGTTLEVAAELQRHGIGIELNESYLRDIAVPLLELATAQMGLL